MAQAQRTNRQVVLDAVLDSERSSKMADLNESAFFEVFSAEH